MFWAGPQLRGLSLCAGPGVTLLPVPPQASPSLPFLPLRLAAGVRALWSKFLLSHLSVSEGIGGWSVDFELQSIV